MEDIDSAIEEAFNSWSSTWDLSQMTIRDIYEAGFRHGADQHQREAKEL